VPEEWFLGRNGGDPALLIGHIQMAWLEGRELVYFHSETVYKSKGASLIMQYQELYNS